MPNPPQPLSSTFDLAFLADRMIATLIRGLLQSDFTLVARPLVRLVRARHSGHAVGADQGRAPKSVPPPGPFRLREGGRACDLLVYVPRSLESYLIDDVTGGYGYSHVAVDLGEVDMANGKWVMTEATMGVGTHRSYLDNYGKRPFIRVPLAEMGVDCGKFRDCVQDTLGEPYGYAEALTWAEIDDPAKQICTDLPVKCLPTKMRMAIVAAARAGQLGRHTVSIHGPARSPLHIFVSPNGFARFFGAPKGHKIKEPDTLVQPQVKRGGPSFPRFWMALLAGLGVAAGLWIGWQLLKPPKRESIPPQ